MLCIFKSDGKYLTTIIDLFDRIGCSLGTSLHTGQTVVPAWKMATGKRNIRNNLIFHSDRGIQYAWKAFRVFVKSYPLVAQSMSRKENYRGNSVAESFIKTLKVELICNSDFKAIEQSKTAVFWYGTRGNGYTRIWDQKPLAKQGKDFINLKMWHRS